MYFEKIFSSYKNLTNNLHQNVIFSLTLITYDDNLLRLLNSVIIDGNHVNNMLITFITGKNNPNSTGILNITID